MYFKFIYLEDSFVLGINVTPTSVDILVDAVLTPEHSLYTPPKVGELYCYKKGYIKFVNVVEVEWKEKNMRPSTDLNGTVDYGNIDYFYQEDGHYFIGGEWGDLKITTNKEPILIFEKDK